MVSDHYLYEYYEQNTLLEHVYTHTRSHTFFPQINVIATSFFLCFIFFSYAVSTFSKRSMATPCYVVHFDSWSIFIVWWFAIHTHTFFLFVCLFVYMQNVSFSFSLSHSSWSFYFTTMIDTNMEIRSKTFEEKKMLWWWLWSRSGERFSLIDLIMSIIMNALIIFPLIFYIIILNFGMKNDKKK